MNDKRKILEQQIKHKYKCLKELETLIKYFESELEKPITYPETFERVRNFVFVHEWRTCDVCFDDFDWGKAPFHYYFDDNKDICHQCAEQSVKMRYQHDQERG